MPEGIFINANPLVILQRLWGIKAEQEHRSVQTIVRPSTEAEIREARAAVATAAV